jgi:tetratricopeptide (TPR) repeat protein
VGLNKLASVLVKAGDLAAARLRYEEDLAIAQQLAAANPSSTTAQRDVSVSLSTLGSVLVRLGDVPAARARYEESLTIRQRLAAANSSSVAAQRDVIIGHVRLAESGLTTHWLAALPLVEALSTKGLLSPSDQKLLDLIRTQASSVR